MAKKSTLACLQGGLRQFQTIQIVDLNSICFPSLSLHSTSYVVAYHPAPLNTTDDHNFYNPLVVYVSTESSVPHHIQIVFPHGMLTEQEGSAENE